jgi:hypothetical protein
MVGFPRPSRRRAAIHGYCSLMGQYVDGPLASVFISAVNGWRPSVICPLDCSRNEKRAEDRMAAIPGLWLADD